MNPVRGFNVGVTVSLGDIELALDYVNNPDIFMPDIENVLKEKNSNRDTVEEDFTAPSSMLMSDDAVVDFDVDTEELEEQDENEGIIIEDSDYFGEDEETEDEELDTEEDIEDIEVDIDEEDDDNIDNDNIDDEEIEIDDSYFDEDDEEEQDTTVKNVTPPISNVKKETVKPVVQTTVAPAVKNNTIPNGSNNNNIKTDTQQTNAKSERELELERKLQEAMAKLNEVNAKQNVKTESNNAPQRKTEPVKQVHVQNKEARIPGNVIPMRKNEHTDMHKSSIQRSVQSTPVHNGHVQKQIGNVQAISKSDTASTENRIELYNGMDIDALYNEVKKYMAKLGVKKSTIDRGILEKEFGAGNIRKLLLKSYIISIGKGITIGK